MKILSKASIAIVVLIIIYLAGPKLQSEAISSSLPELNVNVENVENIVANIEGHQDIRPDNHARIIWANDSLKKKTHYSVLYLHGFGASWYEGHPAHINLSKTIGANLYLSRLHDHGLNSDEALLNMKPHLLYNSAKEALLIAQALGDEVIVMGTSTGATLALMLAADYPEMVETLILLSPNIFIDKLSACVLTKPWGLQIARIIGGDGGKYRILTHESEADDKYWYQRYRWEGVVYLQQLLEENMHPKLFSKITQPIFLGYYYKNEKEQDNVVDVPAMLEMYSQVKTPEHLKRKVAFPDANNHVIACEAKSESINEVQQEIIDFIFSVKNISNQ
jgi:pimeloyl-ACP methyl ester carboxylesterase